MFRGGYTSRAVTPFFYKSTNNQIKTLEKTKNVYAVLTSSISNTKMLEYL